LKFHRNCFSYLISLLSLFLLYSIGVTFARDGHESSVRPDGPHQLPVSRWADPNTHPTSYAEWKAKQAPRGEFEAVRADFRKLNKDNPDFCVFINEPLYSQIEASLDQYLTDLTNEGYNPAVYTISGGTAEDLRNYMETLYVGGMAGCLMIGDLPLAWMEGECDWGHSEYPMDLFFMDFDGIYYDNDGDGIYDEFDETNQGYEPDIVFGRLYASTLTFGRADEVSLLQNYFDKNHRYRTGQLNSNVRGLAYVDDDWAWFADELRDEVDSGYCLAIQVSEETQTTAPDYGTRIKDGYQFVYLHAHSTPTGHYFYGNLPSQPLILTSMQIASMHPETMFYMLYACSAGRFIETDYLAGWYTFNEDYGMGVRAMVATGGNGGREDIIFSAFDAGETIGQAFKDHYSWMLEYLYGQELNICGSFIYTFFGDPTVTKSPRWPVVIDETHLPAARINTPYYKWLTASGGSKPYHWSVTDGQLPTGLTLDDSSAIIQGNLSEIGDYYFSVAATDSCLEDMYADTINLYIGVMETCGDVNNDGTIDLLDILQLIDFKFKEGAPPVVLASADVNSDHTINLLDILYLIEYKFKDGPSPYCFM